VPTADTKPLIYDVGMHLGEDTEYYLKKGFAVVAIEAVEEYCRQVGERLKPAVQDGSLRIVNGAIAEEAGTITFYQNEKKSVWGTADANFAALRSAHGAAVKRVEVQGRTFDGILLEYGMPYYLKVDIEGADRHCLAALRNFTVKPRYLSIEAEMASWDRLVEDIELLLSLGYDEFKPVQQLTVRKQRCPNPPLEGRYVDHRFPKGASGMFGEEAPGSWLSKDATLARFRKIFRMQRWFGSSGYFGASKLSRLLIRDLLRIRPGWYDIHARRSADRTSPKTPA
jgi:FkbM family methyltransferase